MSKNKMLDEYHYNENHDNFLIIEGITFNTRKDKKIRERKYAFTSDQCRSAKTD